MTTIAMTTAVMLLGVAIVASAGLTYAITQTNQSPSTSESVKAIGHITAILYDENGNIKVYRQTDNAIVDVGLDILALNNFNGLTISGATAETVKVMGIGTGTTVNPTDTGLTRIQNCANATVTFTESADDTTTKVRIFANATFTGAGNCVGTIGEAGLGTTATTFGQLFAKQAISPTITVGSADTLDINWDLTFTDT